MAPESTLMSQFSEFIKAKTLLAPGDRIVLAVSGGVDSMVMLDLFQELRRPWNLDLVVAHVNHQLRGDESEGDEVFVRQAAEQSEIPIHCKRADITGLMQSKKISKQEAAREARYEFFEEVRQRTSSQHVATAHQADDNAETVLMNSLRGGGVRALAGIPLVRPSGRVIRPLLFARREDILGHAQYKGIAYRNDSSNESMVYTRNYLRLKIVPLLKVEFGPGVCESLNRMSDTMKEFAEFLEQLVDERSSDVMTFDAGGCQVFIPALRQLPLFLQEEIVLRVLRRFNVEPSAAKIGHILNLCRNQTGRSLDISGQITVMKDRFHLNIVTRSANERLLQDIPIGGVYSCPDFTLSVGVPGPVPVLLPKNGLTEYIAAEKLDQSMVLRSWRNGDWFVPLGMSGRKKLSDFFSDEKISMREKARIPILESHDNIVWVCGKRLDDRYKITSTTRSAVKLSYSPTISPDN